ncbi:MAG: RluA family pseudouridine synthase [Oscillospiraceae bacterium]|nr:RluA family pseudouridine synthase [Oscillospiraceae bacterium]MBQ5337886.1 RluA family pseudouridine synthase [Oscillospiraceae bacterium]MBR5362278.1 RluA family pseudouridine synthase [Oscillospiraceae bacterium]
MPAREELLTVPAEDTGKRLDAWLAAQPALAMTRSAVQQLLEQGQITRNGKAAKKNDKLQSGDEIRVAVPEPQTLDVLPQDIPLEIIYEDPELLVVNKPKGMVVHPAPGHPDGTLVNALLYHCAGRLSGINGVIRPGIVHRIDRDTSGLLIVAKTDRAHLGLAEQIAVHSFTREYEAVCCGRFKETSGTVHAPIGRDPRDRQKMCVIATNSKDAVTHYTVLTQYERHAHIRCRLETGRTHQIRVHMKQIGHPVYGDAVYGKAEKGVEGQCLHAKKIGFVHPVTGEYLEFDSPLPDYFTEILRKLS